MYCYNYSFEKKLTLCIRNKTVKHLDILLSSNLDKINDYLVHVTKPIPWDKRGFRGDYDKFSALSIACNVGDPDKIKLLVEKYNADVNVRIDGTHPLDLLMNNSKFYENLKFMIEHGSNPLNTDVYIGSRPEYVDPRAFVLLVACGINIHKTYLSKSSLCDYLENKKVHEKYISMNDNDLSVNRYCKKCIKYLN